MNNEDLKAELLKDFILESLEGLDSFEHELLELEESTNDPQTLNIIFRVMHSIKGTAGCLGLGVIEKASHKGEDLLTLMRDGDIESTPERISALLSLSDSIRAMLSSLESTGAEGDPEIESLLKSLEQLTRDEAPPVEADNTPAEPQAETEVSTADEAQPAASNGDESFGFFADAPQQPEDAKAGQEAWGFFEDDTAPAEAKAEEPEAPAKPNKPQPETPEAVDPQRPSIANSAIRVDVSHLDKVMNIVGELVLARNQILLTTTNFDEAALAAASQRLNIITTELQENVMKTRMQPIRSVWGKFPRIVRDLANELGKKVKLVMDGQDTELDRTIVEAIKDPLTHIVRNAIDHGIEVPDQRTSADKPEEGLLSLRAYHEGGQVIIEIMDDGRGINVAAIKSKAVSKQLISPSEAERMSDREAMQLIFRPGFSTAEKVSSISGRGVGMDVVRTNIERIGGSIDLQTEQGQGSTIKIKIPLTLAIIPALIVTSGGERYAIPQVNLLELIRIDPEKNDPEIENLRGATVYRSRGRLLPIVYLNDKLGLEPATRDEFSTTNIIVLQADDQEFGLVVDEVNDTEEIVVKPLGKQLKSIACYAGATILGDGSVALILDAMGLAQFSKVVSTDKRKALTQEEEGSAHDDETIHSVVRFKIGDQRIGLPLRDIYRLEKFPLSKFESAASGSVIQYRNTILPLIELSRELGIQSKRVQEEDTEEPIIPVIVYNKEDTTVGLIVDVIEDIVDTPLNTSAGTNRFGFVGSAVILGQVTNLLDAASIISKSGASGRPLVNF